MATGQETTRAVETAICKWLDVPTLPPRDEGFPGDSLDYVEVVMALEEDFRIQISDAEAEHCQTVGDLITLVVEKIDAR